jgi:hypothetical protein
VLLVARAHTAAPCPPHLRLSSNRPASSSPRGLKLSVLASFTDALLLPATLVPRAVVDRTKAVGTRFSAGTVGIGAVMGVAGNAAAEILGMLNQSS